MMKKQSNRPETSISINERSEGGMLIVEMNNIFNHRDWKFKSAIGELTVKTKFAKDNRNASLFPDAIVFEDENNLTPVVGWEFKMPDTPIDDDELFSNAEAKANRLGTSAIALWNFQYCYVFYRKPDNGWSRKPDHIYDQYKDILTNRKNVQKNRELWKHQIDRVLEDLNADLLNNAYKVAPIEFNIGNYVDTISDTLTPLVAEYLTNLKNLKLNSLMRIFSEREKAEFGTSKDKNFNAIANTYAKNIIIRWINRIVFSNLIRSKYDSIHEVLSNFIQNNDIQKFKEDFNKVINKTDFYSILHVDDQETNLPQRVVDNLVEFCHYLLYIDTSQFDSSIVSKVLESLISVAKHKLMGLYTTPKNLAQLLVQVTMIDTDATANFADFTVGSGTIAKAIMDNLKRNGIKVSDIHEQVWASDKYNFPLQVANFNMTTFDSLNLANIVFKSDVLSLKVGQEIDIVNPMNGTLDKKKLPKMGGIMSNLPFISSNNRKKDADTELVKSTLNKYGLNLRSDLYQAIILHYKSLLSESSDARIGVITSNSWFKRNKDTSFFDVLSENFDVKYIIYSDVSRWFDNAAVVSSIIVLGQKSQQPEDVQFISLKKDIRNLSSDEIEKIAASIGLGIYDEIDRKNYSKFTYNLKNISDLTNTGICLEALFDNISWFDNILNKNVLAPITNFMDVIRGSRTGADNLFITDGLKTNPEDSHPYLKTIKNVNSIIVKPTDQYFFYTTDTMEELKQKKHAKTLNYIDSISNSETARKKIKQHHNKWYIAEDKPKYSDFITTMNPDQRWFWAAFKEPIAVNQRLVAAKLKPEYENEKELIHALLNSIISIYILCGSGFARADGVTDLTSDGIKRLNILNPDKLTAVDKKEIVKAWDKIKNKAAVSILEELEDPDWIEFNKLVLSKYNIDSGVFKKAKNSIYKLVKRRNNIKESKKNRFNISK